MAWLTGSTFAGSIYDFRRNSRQRPLAVLKTFLRVRKKKVLHSLEEVCTLSNYSYYYYYDYYLCFLIFGLTDVGI